jgi:hypothetical protein
MGNAAAREKVSRRRGTLLIRFGDHSHRGRFNREREMASSTRPRIIAALISDFDAAFV